MNRFDGDTGQLLAEENYEWGAYSKLDRFFARLYSYYLEKGFSVILLSRVMNLLTLAFTIFFSGFLLLFVNWGAIHACGRDDDCEVAKVILNTTPLKHVLFWKVMVILYLTIFSAYFVLMLVQIVNDMKELADVKDFVNNKLGMSDRELQTITWPELVSRLVGVQEHTRLCITRDLSAHDIVNRIMRKENYLIGMLNKHILALYTPIPGLRHQVLLTKTMEWNLNWCIFDYMFDDKFTIKKAFLEDVSILQKRFRKMAVLNLIMSPFVMVFVVSYFFLQNAEHFYRHPVSVGARQWSLYARWKMREFNELEDHLNRRLDASHKSATKYVLQFPTPMQTQIAKFVAYIAGSFAATCLAVGVMSGPILEKPFLAGQNFIWYTAFFGLILAVSRSFIPEDPIPYKPEEYMNEVVENTHYFPRRWRGKCHTQSVQSEFSFLFKLKVIIFFEEIASIFLTPFILFFSLPECAPRILEFIQNFTEDIEGVGHVCSLAMFDFERHGNVKYGSQYQSEKRFRSKQGKMEKSFLSFCNYYDDWEPDQHGSQFLQSFNKVRASYLENFQSEMQASHLYSRNGNSVLSNQISQGQDSISELTEDQQNLVDLRARQKILEHMYHSHTSAHLPPKDTDNGL